MKGILDKYDKVDSGWIVRYKVNRDNLIVYQHVMLHPNQTNYAEIDKEVEFRFLSCPNLDNGGELEDMAIIDTGEAKSISEIMEKFKGKTMFPQALKRAEESLRGVVLPHVKNNSKMYHENELGKILFDFMMFDRQEGDTRGSVIKRFLSELKNKNNEK
jgi:hypothetical protein